MRLMNRDCFCAALKGCIHLMPQVAKVEFHSAVDKIFAHTVPIEVGSFELLSFGTLKLMGSVKNGGKLLPHALGRVAEFLETLEVV
jgi:hypothetical protein